MTLDVVTSRPATTSAYVLARCSGLRTANIKSVRVDVPYSRFRFHKGVLSADIVFDPMEYGRGRPGWRGYFERVVDGKYVFSQQHLTPSAVMMDVIHGNEGPLHDAYTVTVKVFDECYFVLNGVTRYYTTFTETCGPHQINSFVEQIDDLFKNY